MLLALQEKGELFHPMWFKLRDAGKAYAKGADHWLGQTLIRTPDKPGPSMWVYADAYFVNSPDVPDWSRCPDLYLPD